MMNYSLSVTKNTSAYLRYPLYCDIGNDNNVEVNYSLHARCCTLNCSTTCRHLGWTVMGPVTTYLIIHLNYGISININMITDYIIITIQQKKHHSSNYMTKFIVVIAAVVAIVGAAVRAPGDYCRRRIIAELEVELLYQYRMQGLLDCIVGR